jgi:hypothetical protein
MVDVDCHGVLCADVIGRNEAISNSHALTATSSALRSQADLQGTFIFAKAKESAMMAAESVDHLCHYFERCCFNP